MPIPNTLEKTITEMFPGAPLGDALAQLVAEYKTPVRIAQVTNSYPNAVRNMMEKHGYNFVPGGWERTSENVQIPS